MSVMTIETHKNIVRKIKKRAFIIECLLFVSLAISMVFPWLNKLEISLIRESYGVVKYHLIELKSKYALLEILRNKPLTIGQAMEVADVVIDESRANDVPIHMILGVMSLESEFNPNAVSSAGARGLMQVTSTVFNHYISTDPFREKSARHSPVLNIVVGVRYLGDLMKQYGDWGKALKVYGGFVSKDPDRYVSIVMANAESFRMQLGDDSGSSFSNEIKKTKVRQ